jgi:hypothetical protein
VPRRADSPLTPPPHSAPVSRSASASFCVAAPCAQPSPWAGPRLPAPALTQDPRAGSRGGRTDSGGGGEGASQVRNPPLPLPPVLTGHVSSLLPY